MPHFFIIVFIRKCTLWGPLCHYTRFYFVDSRTCNSFVCSRQATADLLYSLHSMTCIVYYWHCNRGCSLCCKICSFVCRWWYASNRPGSWKTEGPSLWTTVILKAPVEKLVNDSRQARRRRGKKTDFLVPEERKIIYLSCIWTQKLAKTLCWFTLWQNNHLTTKPLHPHQPPKYEWDALF